LEALRRARFSIWRIERYHEAAGLILTDLLTDSETWMVDEALTGSASLGSMFAARLCWPAEFAMTCGVIVPIDAELLEQVIFESAP
jgi:hypothetical protein